MHCRVIFSQILTFQYFLRILRFIFTARPIQHWKIKTTFQLFPQTCISIDHNTQLKYTRMRGLREVLISSDSHCCNRPKTNNRSSLLTKLLTTYASSSVRSIHLVNGKCDCWTQFMFPNTNTYTMIVQISRSLLQLLLNKYGRTTNPSVKTIPVP